ncbi:MAG: IMPACT family protein [Ignavibacteriales bacterium]
MQFPEEFFTIGSNTEYKFKEKGSVFIGQCYPVSSTEEANSILENIRKKYYDATHHCFAYTLINNDFKYSDDGEPSGTAGIRIFNSIQHFSLTNILVVVIRYFGGTKLGVGPLGKAYYNAAFSVLEQSEKIKRTSYKKITISSGFMFISHIHHALSKVTAKITNTRYENSVNIDCIIIPADLPRLTSLLNEAVSGKVQIIDHNEYTYL